MPHVAKNVQDALIEYAQYILTQHKESEEYINKMEAVDKAYALYKENIDSITGVIHGEGIDAATAPAGVFNSPSTTPPVIVAQVDSMVGYLSEVFLSGTPLFPIVSSPSNREDAATLEAVFDDHSKLGGYPRQLLMLIRDSIKYNLGAVELDWTAIPQYDVMDELIAPGKNKIKRNAAHFTKLTRMDLYNTIWDRNTNPGDISAEGDYAGHISILSRQKLKRLLNSLSDEKEGMNANEALASYITSDAPNYRLHPQISNFISARKPISTNWEAFLQGGIQSNNDDGRKHIIGNYELLKIYARLCPSDIGIPGPARNTPQIYQFQIINGSILISVKRIVSAFDYLPILFCQPFEDGLGYQTKSTAESSLPIQEAAGTLFNISFNAARRAVSDRALYDPNAISQKDINAPVPAPKIPVKLNQLLGRPISDAYHQIPFDPRGTEGAMQSGMQIVSFGRELSGLNNPMQGQFQKGNKSVQEWRDTMGGADSRLRLPALAMENQLFGPLKEILKFNIFQYGEDSVVISQRTGEEMAVKIQELRQKVLTFQVADGYTPKSKLASTEAIIQIMTMISQSPILQQTYGTMLPSIVAHLAQLMGVKGMSEYAPQANAPQAPLLGIEDKTKQANPNFLDNIQENDLRQQELAAREQGLQLRQQELGAKQ